MEYLSLIPSVLLNFILVTVFSLIIGLSQKGLHSKRDVDLLFGTDRTFTFIGILGYILFILDPVSLFPFIAGAFILTVFFAIYYVQKIRDQKHYGATTMIIAILTYVAPALLGSFPVWMYLLVMVTLILFSEMKDQFSTLSLSFDRDEFITLGKFLVIAGIILPLVPDKPIVSFLSITPYKIWLAVVIISSISYVSYLLHKFVFKKSGILLSGILGGLYSSTATTIVLARKSKLAPAEKQLQYTAAIILATSMMYLRILLLILIFNQTLFHLLYIFMLLLFGLSVTIGIFLWFKGNHNSSESLDGAQEDKNPLEFKVALLFTVLFVAFSFITYYTLSHFGNLGLSILSLIVGMTDIDPFLLNLFQGKYDVTVSVIGIATLQAIISNNFVKAAYASVLGNKALRKPLLLSFSAIILVNILLAFFL
ncbi:MAG: DUF4010 domain-containing protein [Bacteroidales bacterium]